MSGESLDEPFEEVFKTEDNYDITVGETKVIEHLIHRFLDSKTWKPCEEVNCNFTFASYGTVIGLRKNYKILENDTYLKEHPKCTYEVETFREFLCFYEPHHKGEAPTACGDARAYGHMHWIYINDIWKELPENFVKRYVNDALNKKINYNLFDDWDVEQWLKKFGIYDDVKKLFDKQKHQDVKDKEEKNKELKLFTKEAQNYLAGLTEEQKEQLKQLLL